MTKGRLVLPSTLFNLTRSKKETNEKLPPTFFQLKLVINLPRTYTVKENPIGSAVSDTNRQTQILLLFYKVKYLRARFFSLM